jgi:hypothetical protein
MRLARRRLSAVAALAALLCPVVLGWAVALHHAGHDEADDAGSGAGIELALHGHSHVEGTPAHGHPVVGSVAAPLPERAVVVLAAFVGPSAALDPADLAKGRVQSGQRRPHDRPPRPPGTSILRI